MRTMGFRVDQRVYEQSKIVSIPTDFQHAICFGMTGSGKTSSLVLPTLKDRLLKGYGIIAYTYKGHEHRKIKYLAQEANRLEDVIEIGKPYGVYINLLSLLERNEIHRVLKALIGGKGEQNGDDYWRLSATRLGVLIIDILRKIHQVEMIITQKLKKDSVAKVHLANLEQNGDTALIEYQYPTQEPSFKTLATIAKSPKSLKYFLIGVSKVIEKVKRSIQNKKPSQATQISKSRYVTKGNELLFRDKKAPNEEWIEKVAILLLKIEDIMELYEDYSINISAEDATGNNGVLQVLNNAIQNIATKDYINTDEIDIITQLNSGKIAIVDIEGIDSDLHGILLESVLKKLSSRIRYGSPPPISIFIDEANRVLESTMDIHNDTLRESNVELILATQNEDQMIDKFNYSKWESLRKNFKHQYYIDQDHFISYNGEKLIKAKAIVIDETKLNETEFAFNELYVNQKLFIKRFHFEDSLPKRFLIHYDIVRFEKEMSITLIDENNNTKEVEYIGTELKKRFEETMKSLGYLPIMETIVKPLNMQRFNESLKFINEKGYKL